MSFVDLSRAALRVQYRIVRYPLGLIEKQMATRLGPRALPRLLYERSLGLLDAAAGNVLDAPALAQRGVTKIEQSDNRMRAADLDAEADATVADASSKLKDARAAAAQTEEVADARKPASSSKHEKPPTNASGRREKLPSRARTPPKSGPTTRLVSARARRRQPKKKGMPSFMPARKPPKPTRKPSLNTRARPAAPLHTNAPRQGG